MRRRRRLLAPGALAVVLASFGLSSWLSAASGAPSPKPPALVGIVNAFGPEQAAILTEMKVTGHRDVEGFRFWLGTIAGKPVVDVAGGEADETAELSSNILATRFHPKAILFSGTAGAQNAAEENEGSGFAFAGAQSGVPWLLVRGISDSVWYPNAYDGVLASQHAATVVKYLVAHLPATVDKAPETLKELPSTANASRAGSLIAKRAYFKVSSVGKVVYAGQGGTSVTLSGGRLPGWPSSTRTPPVASADGSRTTRIRRAFLRV